MAKLVRPRLTKPEGFWDKQVRWTDRGVNRQIPLGRWYQQTEYMDAISPSAVNLSYYLQIEGVHI
jgi:hypothetical protein